MPKELKHYFGIDFGTTNSATVGLAVMDNKTNMFLYGDDEDRPIPSVVAINKNTGEIYTGRDAWNKKMELAETCVYISSVKSILDSDWTQDIAGRTWTTTDVATEVFKALKANVAERTGAEMTSATVAIPIGFVAEKRERLRIAARNAGIVIDSFISEPTAAFFANYEALKSCSTIAVFDWGGGTLDVSIIQNSNGKISEMATEGMNVAGDDLDRKIAKRIHARIARKKGVEMAFEDMPHSAQDLLLVRAERAKRALSDDETATISMLKYGEYGACRETLDYDWFAEIVNPEVDAAIACLERAITESEVGLANIDRIVMIGGSSNLRPLLEKMERKYGELLYFPEQTMWNVGQGAAQLNMIPGEYYTNQSVGLILSDGSYFELLPKNTKVTGWKRELSFALTDTTEEARFVFSGSSDIDASSLKYRSLLVPSYRFLQEKIKLTVAIDENLVFQAMAKSDMRPLEFSRFWNYEQLKCYYRLPDMR